MIQDYCLHRNRCISFEFYNTGSWCLKMYESIKRQLFLPRFRSFNPNVGNVIKLVSVIHTLFKRLGPQEGAIFLPLSERSLVSGGLMLKTVVSQNIESEQMIILTPPFFLVCNMYHLLVLNCNKC